MNNIVENIKLRGFHFMVPKHKYLNDVSDSPQFMNYTPNTRIITYGMIFYNEIGNANPSVTFTECNYRSISLDNNSSLDAYSRGHLDGTRMLTPVLGMDHTYYLQHRSHHHVKHNTKWLRTGLSVKSDTSLGDDVCPWTNSTGCKTP